MAMREPDYLTRYDAPSGSSDFSLSQSFDYGGLEDLVKRQDAISGLRDKKFAANYTGNIPEAVTAGSQIRDLLAAVRKHTPAANERFPVQAQLPLVATRSISISGDDKGDGGGFSGVPEQEPEREIPAGMAPPVHRKPPPMRTQKNPGRTNGVLGSPLNTPTGRPQQPGEVREYLA